MTVSKQVIALEADRDRWKDLARGAARELREAKRKPWRFAVCETWFKLWDWYWNLKGVG